MEYLIFSIVVIVGFIIFLIIKKSDYDKTTKEPEKGGIDDDSNGDGEG